MVRRNSVLVTHGSLRVNKLEVDGRSEKAGGWVIIDTMLYHQIKNKDGNYSVKKSKALTQTSNTETSKPITDK